MLILQQPLPSVIHKVVISPGGCRGGTKSLCSEGGERRKLQPANPTAMILLLPPASRCESEGVAFEVLVCLAGKAPKIAQKDSCGRQNLFISIFRVCVWKTGREHAKKTNMTSE